MKRKGLIWLLLLLLVMLTGCTQSSSTGTPLPKKKAEKVDKELQFETEEDADRYVWELAYGEKEFSEVEKLFASPDVLTEAKWNEIVSFIEKKVRSEGPDDVGFEMGKPVMQDGGYVHDAYRITRDVSVVMSGLLGGYQAFFIPKDGTFKLTKFILITT